MARALVAISKPPVTVVVADVPLAYTYGYDVDLIKYGPFAARDESLFRSIRNRVRAGAIRVPVELEAGVLARVPYGEDGEDALVQLRLCPEALDATLLPHLGASGLLVTVFGV